MITLRMAHDRRHERRGGQDTWLSLTRKTRGDPLAIGLGALELFGESLLGPGARMPHGANRDAEIVTYVRTGTLAYDDGLGLSGEVLAGEVQRRNARRGVRYREKNASKSDEAQVFQIGPRAATAGLEPNHPRRRFSMAQRRGLMCVVASSDARGGSLPIRQDAVIISAVLGPGQHVVHALSPGRSAYLHVVHGELRMDDLVLTTGDGARFTAERAVSFTSSGQTEIVLVDLCEGMRSRGLESNRRVANREGEDLEPSAFQSGLGLPRTGRRSRLVTASCMCQQRS